MATLLDDSELLQAFRDQKSRDALDELIRRHIDFVYATALRQVGDPALAEDIAQAVFIILSRKAGSLQTGNLLGWLFRTTRYAARNALKMRARRDYHERRAARVETHMDTGDAEAAELLPLLNDALATLGETDRNALLMRYMQGKSAAEVGAALGLTEAATRKRMERALEKLRKIFARHRLTATPAMVSGVVSLMSSASTPSELTTTVATAVWQGTGPGLSIAVAATRSLVWGKVKIAMLVGGLALTVGVTAALVERGSGVDSRAAVASRERGIVGELKNGVSIEVVGLAPNPAAGQSWWRADGSTLTQSPYYTMGSRSFADATHIARDIALRIDRTVSGSADPASVKWTIVNSGGAASSSPVDRSGRQVNYIEASSVSMPNLPEGVTLRADVAAGAWKTVAEVPADKGGIKSTPQFSCLVARVFESRNDACTIITINGQVNDSMRVIAIDSAGKLHVGLNRESIATEGAQMAEYHFSRVKAADLKTIQFQTRPWDQWIEIRNICVDPARPTKPETASSDGSL